MKSEFSAINPYKSTQTHHFPCKSIPLPFQSPGFGWAALYRVRGRGASAASEAGFVFFHGQMWEKIGQSTKKKMEVFLAFPSFSSYFFWKFSIYFHMFPEYCPNIFQLLGKSTVLNLMEVCSWEESTKFCGDG